jgi:hypothetical protein
MSESAIRQKLFDILSSVPGVGRVYDYERWTADWTKFLELFKDSSSGRILGWEISRNAVESQFLSRVEEEATHRFVIKGYLGVKDADATEKLFNGLIEVIRAAFRGNVTLDGVAELASPLTVPIIDVRTFGSVLCHYCELHLAVTEYSA